MIFTRASESSSHSELVTTTSPSNVRHQKYSTTEARGHKHVPHQSTCYTPQNSHSTCQEAFPKRKGASCLATINFSGANCLLQGGYLLLLLLCSVIFLWSRVVCQKAQPEIVECVSWCCGQWGFLWFCSLQRF